ncbi:MAG: PAS domain S-box protein [Candidatus Odinarchaeota archaeon]
MEFSENKFLKIIDSIKEGYFEVDLQGNFTFFNKSLLKFTGYSKAELLGLNYKYIADEKNKKKIFEGFNTVYKTGEPLTDFEYQFKNKNGEKTIGETSVYLKYNSKGEKIGFFGLFRDVTKRKEEEERFKQELEQLVNLRTEELRESEEKHRFITENAMDLIAVIDMKMKFEYVNEKVHNKIMGYKKEDLIGKNAISFIHPDDREKVLQTFKEATEKGETFTEVRIKHKDGHYVWTGNNGSIYIDKNGKPKFLIIARDITKRKKAETKLMESEEKYRNIINHLDLGFYQLSWDGILLNHNPRFCEILGYDQFENLKNKDVHDFWQNPEDRSVYLKELEKNGFVKNYQILAKKKNGEKIVLQLNSHILEMNKRNNSIIQGLISDITEKFELEQKLKESEERYRNLIESVPFSIALIDQQGTMVYCNPSIEELLGYRQDELVGYKFKDLPAVHPKYIPLLLNRFKKVLMGEILPPLEMELYKKDGSLIWIKYQSTLVKLGNEVLLQTVINDITEQKHADLLIEEEIIKLKELDQIRKDLISRISHELKTPLVSVCGAAELLLDIFIEQFKGEPKELLEMIEKGGRRLKYLVDNLVDITRIEYQKFKLQKTVNDFSKIVRDCANELIYLIKKRGLNLELDIMDDLFIEIDRIRIEQVILNLLSNAIKNTPPSGKIIIKLLQLDNSVQLSISDSGIGLTKEEIGKLFTRFGKIERYGDGLEYIDIQGTGLGLYISKEIMDLHEGQIWVESEGRDKGSIFTITLPLSR